MHIVYLDEFGHIGPYVSREHARFNESPVFGMAGLILPADKAREFATWFFKRKGELLSFEIALEGAQPATWEKKGSSLYTAKNILKYRELRDFTNRLLNHIQAIGGHVIYVGLQKQAAPEAHKSTRMYLAVLRELVKRVNGLCENVEGRSSFIMVMDEHSDRQAIITEISKVMFAGDHPSRRLIEPPFQVESHRYQTIQAADWICGLVGRLGCYQARPLEYPELAAVEQYFGARLRKASVASGIRSDRLLQAAKITSSSLNSVL